MRDFTHNIPLSYHFMKKQGEHVIIPTIDRNRE